MKLAKVTILSGISTLARMATGVVVAKIVAVYAGPTGLAQVGQIQSFVTAVAGVVATSVGTGIVKYTSGSHGDQDVAVSYWRAAVSIASCLVVAAAAGVVASATNLSHWLTESHGLSGVLILFSLLLPFYAANGILSSVLNGLESYTKLIYSGIASSVFGLAIMAAMVAVFGGAAIFYALIVSGAASGAFLIWACRNESWFKTSSFFGAVKVDRIRQMGGYWLMGVTTAVTAPLSLIVVRDILIENASWRAAGEWQAVWKVSEIYLGVVTTALATYYLPQLSKAIGPHELRKVVVSTAQFILPLVFIAALIIYVARYLIIGLVFSDEFYGAESLFGIQLIGDIVKISAWLVSFILSARGLVSYFIISEILFSGLFVALAYIIVPHYGASGLNIAYVINYVVYLFAMLAVTWPHLKIVNPAK